MAANIFHGSRSPFAGWVTDKGRPQPADAIVVSQPLSGSWNLTLWEFPAEGSGLSLVPKSAKWTSSDDWSINFEGNGSLSEVSLHGGTVHFQRESPSLAEQVKIELQHPPARGSEEVARLQESFEIASKRYPRYRELLPYRLRATGLILGLILFQELLLLFGRRSNRELRLICNLGAICLWLGLGLWLHFFYLSVA